jgi:HSP20 family protein
VIKGERKMDGGVKMEDYSRNEIAYGTFYRAIAIPANADAKNIDAMYEDDILTIKLQRAAGAKPRKVNVAFKKPASA